MAVKKRILIFTSSFPSPRNRISGIFVEDLTKALSAHFDVVVLAPALPGVDHCEYRDGMKILRFRQGIGGICLAGSPGGILPALKRNRFLLFWLPFFLALELFALMRTVREEKIDLIHAHWLLPQGFLAAIYKTVFNRRLRLLVTCHGSDLLKVNGKLLGWMKRYSLCHADAVTVVSELLRRKAEALGNRKSHVLPMGVDTRLFSPEAATPDFRARLGLKRNVILFVGSLIELKGVRALVAAMPEVIRKEPDTSLLLVGGGELEQELKFAVQKSGLEEHVVFAGARVHSELPEFFAGSDIFILPSFSEGWPLVVMEALSSGLTVVVSRLPVFMEHPDRDKLFLTVTAGDSRDIAETLIRALHMRSTAARKQGRAYAVREFDLAVVGARYTKLINELL